MKPIIVINCGESLTKSQRVKIKHQVQQRLGKRCLRKPNVEVLVMCRPLEARILAPYTFRESMDGYSWEAGVQTMDDLVRIAGEGVGLAEGVAEAERKRKEELK